MPQIINTNIASINAQRNLDKSQSANQTALQRLSSGLRINSAKDDAAGLAISTRFTSQIKGLNVATRNAGDGIALAQTAEGALGSINDSLQRIRELAVQSANATNSDVDRDALQAEVDQLVAEISRTAEETDFNGRKLLDGSFSATFQVGANAGQTVDVSIAELTANKLGASEQSGLSARGTDESLGNGDLTINGVAVQASRAEDDTASTANNAASAIAKAAAINRVSDQTGVTAQVNENVAAGSEMLAEAGQTGTFDLNGVEISFATTGDAAQTRAAITQAINAVADQTGVKAIDTDSGSTGVNLVADDGRNIDISNVAFTGTDFAAATGLASAGTYEGGYTLIADGDQKTIEISGGNGTGRGDLANAGLTAGTYDRAEAVTVSSKVADTTTSSALGNDGSRFGTSDRIDAGGTLVTGSATIANAGGAAAITTSNATEVVVDVDGTPAAFNIAAGQNIAQVAATLDANAAIDVAEEISFNLTGYSTNAGLAGNLRITDGTNNLDISLGASNLVDNNGNGTAGEAEDQIFEILNAIQNADVNAVFGADVTITAELNAAGDEVEVKITNKGGVALSAVANNNGTDGLALTSDLAGVSAINGTANFLSGELKVTNSDPTKDVSISFTDVGAAAGANALVSAADGSDTFTVVGSNVNGSSNPLDLTTKIGNAAAVSTSIDAGSSVADVASTLNNVEGISAWEEASFTIDVSASDLTVGDTLTLGAIGGTTQNVAITADETASDADYAAALVDDINGTDFSSTGMEISATLNNDGDVVVNVRNYTANDIGVSSDGEYRRLALDSDNDGTVENYSSVNQRQISGELKFVSDDGRDVAVTLADPFAGGELFSGTSKSEDYTGVNGLQDGDVLINGVTIGGAEVGADTASATTSSDGFRILSSEKSLSAIAVAEAINKVSDETGVTAEINETKVVGGDGTNANLADFEEGDQAGLYINGVNIGTVTLQNESGGTTVDSDRARADALNLINQNAGKTGVTAVDNGVSLTLTAADGRNISIAIDDQSGSDSSIGAIFGLDAGTDGIGESTFGAESVTTGATSAEASTYQTTYGTVKLTSAKEFTLEGGANGNGELDALGLKTGTYGGGEDGQFLKDIDISTFEGAQAAITAIDNAIGQVASQRADLGAIQNRLESTVSNLQITSENLNAANSRIQDADFAAETAELQRTNVLQQAGISVLAQANAAGQQVLSLLG